VGQKKPVGAHFQTFNLHFYPKDGIIVICIGVDMVGWAGCVESLPREQCNLAR